YLDEMEYADAMGFDAVCVNEHHANGYGLMPSPNLIASIMARRTRDAAICVMGNSLALYNPPLRVAEEMAMIDCISGGRLIAGFPVGTPMDTCYAYGVNPSQLRARYHEAHDLVIRAWSEPKPFSFNGRFTKLRYVNAWPRPVQKPRPPVWIPGGGSIETWKWCVEMDYVYCYLSYHGYKAAQATMDGFWREVRSQGKHPNPYRAGFLQFVGVAETHDEAMRLYKEPAEYFYNTCLHVDGRFASPPGYASEATMRARIQSQVVKIANVAAASGTNAQRGVYRPWETILNDGYVIAGDPDECAAQLRRAAEKLNVGHLLMLLHFGNMTADLTRYNTRLFAEKVMPQLRDLFDEEWQDQWWPKPIATGRRAAALAAAE
ncbi:MAG: LLM class flavin-dependent oxidoreductase, partial [Alphaproteobacteria bacterium]|nr:LLM class flavin-dependent oxidoreductase [Alphaproteobacteria bacterium]